MKRGKGESKGPSEMVGKRPPAGWPLNSTTSLEVLKYQVVLECSSEDMSRDIHRRFIGMLFFYQLLHSNEAQLDNYMGRNSVTIRFSLCKTTNHAIV